MPGFSTHVNHSRNVYDNHLNISSVRKKNKNPDALGFGYSKIDWNLPHILPSDTLLLALCYVASMLLDFNCY